jgi:hypothetical protein
MLQRVFVVGCFLGIVGTAHAHVALQYPESRNGHDDIKEPPCGIEGSQRGDKYYMAQPGTPIQLVMDEYINHPGWFRIAFDDNGEDALVEPHLPCADPKNNPDLCFDKTTAPLGWVQNLFPHGEGSAAIWNYNYTLPNITCDNCTLQVIQVMTDKAPFETPGNDIYYQCVDLVLSAEAPAGGLTLIDPTPDDEPPGNSGCNAGSTHAGWLALSFLAFALRRRATA